MTFWLILLGTCLIVAMIGNKIRERLIREQGHLIQYLKDEREILEETIQTAILLIAQFSDRLDEEARNSRTFQLRLEELLAVHESVELARKLRP